MTSLVDDLIATRKKLVEKQMALAALEGKKQAALDEMTRIKAELESLGVTVTSLGDEINRLEQDIAVRARDITDRLNIINYKLDDLFKSK